MRKVIMKATFVAAVALVAAMSVQRLDNQKTNMSALLLANVEALADDELGDELREKIWDRYDYELDNGTPAVNCFRGGSADCLL